MYNTNTAEAQFRRKSGVKKGKIEDSSEFAVEVCPQPSRPGSGLCALCRATEAAVTINDKNSSSNINKVSFPEHVRLLEENRVLRIQVYC